MWCGSLGKGARRLDFADRLVVTARLGGANSASSSKRLLALALTATTCCDSALRECWARRREGWYLGTGEDEPV